VGLAGPAGTEDGRYRHLIGARCRHLLEGASRFSNLGRFTEATKSCRDCLDLDWNKHVEIDPRYFRPAEVDLLLGDSTKARRTLGWEPKVGFKQLARMMVDHDMTIAKQEAIEELVQTGGGYGLFTGCAAGDTALAVIVKVD
jgi:hypothetical protein